MECDTSYDPMTGSTDGLNYHHLRDGSAVQMIVNQPQKWYDERNRVHRIF